MSRYWFTHEDEKVLVGWDNPTQTFFADLGERRSTMLDDGDFNITNVDDLAEKIGMAIPDDIKTKLERDRDTAPPPTPLQALIGSKFRSH